MVSRQRSPVVGSLRLEQISQKMLDQADAAVAQQVRLISDVVMKQRHESCLMSNRSEACATPLDGHRVNRQLLASTGLRTQSGM